MVHSKKLDQAPNRDAWFLLSTPTIQPSGGSGIIDWSGKQGGEWNQDDAYILMETAKMDPVFITDTNRVYQAFEKKRRKKMDDNQYQVCFRRGADTSHCPYFSHPLPAVLVQNQKGEEIPVLFLVDNNDTMMCTELQNAVPDLPPNVRRLIRDYSSEDRKQKYHELVENSSQNQAFQYIMHVCRSDQVAVCILQKERLPVWIMKRKGNANSSQLEHVLTQVGKWAQTHLYWSISPRSENGVASRDRLQTLMDEHGVS